MSWTRSGLAVMCALAMGLASPAPARASGDWEWPVEGTVTVGYGARYATEQGTACTHGGVDIGAPEGTTVRACAAGEVTFSGLVPAGEGERAWAVTVLTGDGLRVTYLPLSRASVSKGADVAAGAALGELAGAGDASSASPHLHLGVRRGETRLDPLAFLGEAAPAPQTPPGRAAFASGRGHRSGGAGHARGRFGSAVVRALVCGRARARRQSGRRRRTGRISGLAGLRGALGAAAGRASRGPAADDPRAAGGRDAAREVGRRGRRPGISARRRDGRARVPGSRRACGSLRLAGAARSARRGRRGRPQGRSRARRPRVRSRSKRGCRSVRARGHSACCGACGAMLHFGSSFPVPGRCLHSPGADIVRGR